MREFSHTIRTYTPYPLTRDPLIRNQSLESIRKTYTNQITSDQNALELIDSQSLVEIHDFLIKGRGVQLSLELSQNLSNLPGPSDQ